MPFTNFPGGVASFGVPVFGTSIYDLPSGSVWFVCNRAGVISGDGTSRDKPFPSIADAVAKIATTNPSLGDTIIVLAGHAENVTASNVFSASLVNTAAVSIPAGTRIIGEGFGAQRPTLTFTAAASTITLANSSCTLENLVLLGPQTGTTTTAALVTVTGANCLVRNCDMQMGTSGTALVTTGVTVGTNATQLQVTDNYVYAAATATPTSWLQLTNTNAPARVFILRNTAHLVLSSATGALVDVSGGSGTAPLGWVITDNNFINLATNSTVAIKGVSGCTGTVAYNNLGITNATGGATAVNTPGSWNMAQNFGGVQGKQGIAITPASG